MMIYKQASILVSRLAGALTVGFVAVLFALPQGALAQTGDGPQFADDREAAGDPPAQVGRLAEVQGSVWLFHPEEGEWINALRNRPVTSGDRLSTDSGGRLELRIGSTALRMDGDSDIEIDRLDDEAIEIRLINGSLAVRLRSDDAARGLLLSTDDGQFTVLGRGSYRLDRRDAVSEITVWGGQATYNNLQTALTVYQGQRAAFWIDANRQPQYSLGQPRFDAFASWSSELDRVADSGPAPRYVSPEMTGAEDLDRYGRWNEDQDYGPLWTPNQVPADWAPYAAGHWAWVSPWGWSWVDDAPWGFAPFHYGRWIVLRDRWRWAPGRLVARPVYAPALVGWIGGAGAGLSLTIGGGPGVGWFPLAPREAWVPPYRISRGYMRNVNSPSFHDQRDIDRLIRTPSGLRNIDYRNRRIDRGTTTMPIEAFTRRGHGNDRIGVDSQWRGSSRSNPGFDRLPGHAVSTLPPPVWLGQRGDRPADRRDSRNPGRDAGRRGDVMLPPSVQPPPVSQRPFVRPPDSGPGDERPNKRLWRDPAQEARQNRSPVFDSPVMTAPVSPPVQAAPVSPPAGMRETRPGSPDRAGRPERPERPDRPQSTDRPDRAQPTDRPERSFDRGDSRGNGRSERPPAQMPERPQPAAAAPVFVQPPVMQAPPVRQVDPASRGSREPREQREAQEQQRSVGERGGNIRDPRLRRGPPELQP